MIFYTGTHNPAWLNTVRIPWFVSVKRVMKRKSSLPGDWILDSGGFTEISKNGKYTFTAEEYAQAINWTGAPYAFCMDWMCEDYILNKTGMSVVEHQSLTTKSFKEMRTLVGDRALPVLQGRSVSDYIHHLKVYKQGGLTNEHTIFGLGSVCKRQLTDEIVHIINGLRAFDDTVKLHGFGVKVTALQDKFVVDNLYSADSMSWSFEARMGARPSICRCDLKACNNCMEFALLWRRKVLNDMKDSVPSIRPDLELTLF